jgi:hypothetical protein
VERRVDAHCQHGAQAVGIGATDAGGGILFYDVDGAPKASLPKRFYGNSLFNAEEWRDRDERGGIFSNLPLRTSPSGAAIASALRRCPSGCLRQAVSLRSILRLNLLFDTRY